MLYICHPRNLPSSNFHSYLIPYTLFSLKYLKISILFTFPKHSDPLLSSRLYFFHLFLLVGSFLVVFSLFLLSFFIAALINVVQLSFLIYSQQTIFYSYITLHIFLPRDLSRFFFLVHLLLISFSSSSSTSSSPFSKHGFSPFPTPTQDRYYPFSYCRWQQVNYSFL